LEYDCNFGALVRKKSKFPIDGIPLAVGIACILKQFHSSYTRKLLAYLGQFVRTTLHSFFSEVDTKALEVPREILNTLVFMDHLCHYASVPRSAVYAYVPPYIFDSMKFSTGVPVKK
jgi:WASH complex subunit strumpellin